MIEFFGILHWNDYSEVKPKSFEEVEPDYIASCAKAHEEAGYARVLIANSAHRPDSLPIATWAAAATSKLGFMLAHRPGFIAPTMAARMFAILDRMSGGRCGVHIITGGDDNEVQADGDFTFKDDRYRRSHEYVEVMRKSWAGIEPFDHDGEFYKVVGGFSHVRPLAEGGIPIFWGGSSPASIKYGSMAANIYAFPGFSAQSLRAGTQEVLDRARGLGRELELLTSLKILVDDAEEKAWERAYALQDQLIEEVVDNGRFEAPAGESRQARIDLAKAQVNDGALVGRLWSGIARVPTGRPSLPCLVGSYDQVAQALQEYHQLGFTKFILSGYDTIADARLFGAELMPRVREICADTAQSD